MSATSTPKFAIVGAGCAGLAVAWNLLRQASSRKRRVIIDVYDTNGIGYGATGVAAGLIHPFAPSGKLLWRGTEAFEDAVELVNAATAHSSRNFSQSSSLFRPALKASHLRKFEKNIGWSKSTNAAKLISVHSLEELFLSSELDHVSEGNTSSQLTSSVSGVWIEDGLILDPVAYLEAVWSLCMATAHSSNCSVSFHEKPVHSLKTLEQHDENPYFSIVVTAGAAVGKIEEMGSMFALDLCQGYTAAICPSGPSLGDHEHGNRVSLIGNPYVAFHGPEQAILGATQRHGMSLDDAVSACDPKKWSLVAQDPEAIKAAETLLTQASSLLPYLETWKIAQVRSGVRGLPTRTSKGAMPYAGIVPGTGHDRWWAIAGLGSRGLLYHAWLGKLLAQAVWEKDETALPPELLRWR